MNESVVLVVGGAFCQLVSYYCFVWPRTSVLFSVSLLSAMFIVFKYFDCKHPPCDLVWLQVADLLFIVRLGSQTLTSNEHTKCL